MNKFLGIFAFLTLLRVSEGAFAGFLCPTTPNGTVFFPCNKDCIDQHGAVDGVCGNRLKGDYNCYCGATSGKRFEPSLQCIQPNQQRYRDLCNADCRCSHGATGGRCDDELKACICYGYNPTNKNCPVKTVEDFARLVLEKAGKKDLGPRGLAFVGQIIPIPPN